MFFKADRPSAKRWCTNCIGEHIMEGGIMVNEYGIYPAWKCTHCQEVLCNDADDILAPIKDRLDKIMVHFGIKGWYE